MARERFFSNDNTTQPSHASHPDRAEDYKQYDQKRWQQFSSETIDLLAKMLLTVKDESGDKFAEFSAKTKAPKGIEATELGRVFLFLAARRFDIAQELGHGKRDDRQKHYGRFRDVNYDTSEKLSQNSPMFPTQRPHIFDEVYSLVTVTVGRIGGGEKGLNYQDDRINFIGFVDKPTDDDRPPVGDYTIMVKNPLNAEARRNAKTLQTMNLRVFDEKQKDTVRLSYASPKTIVADFATANELYLACKNANSLDDFLFAAGKLSYYLEVNLPLKLGSSGVIEWLVRGMAKSKGYDLGPFNTEGGLGWDFKALLSTNMDDYASWYQKNAFKNIRKLEEEEEQLDTTTPTKHGK